MQINTHLHGAQPEPRAINCLKINGDRPLHTELMTDGKQIYKPRRRASHAHTDWRDGTAWVRCLTRWKVTIIIVLVNPSPRTWKFAYSWKLCPAIMNSDS
jgi:hypothetical protein